MILGNMKTLNYASAWLKAADKSLAQVKGNEKNLNSFQSAERETYLTHHSKTWELSIQGKTSK